MSAKINPIEVDTVLEVFSAELEKLPERDMRELLNELGATISDARIKKFLEDAGIPNTRQFRRLVRSRVRLTKHKSPAERAAHSHSYEKQGGLENGAGKGQSLHWRGKQPTEDSVAETETAASGLAKDLDYLNFKVGARTRLLIVADEMVEALFPDGVKVSVDRTPDGRLRFTLKNRVDQRQFTNYKTGKNPKKLKLAEIPFSKVEGWKAHGALFRREGAVEAVEAMGAVVLTMPAVLKLPIDRPNAKGSRVRKRAGEPPIPRKSAAVDRPVSAAEKVILGAPQAGRNTGGRPTLADCIAHVNAWKQEHGEALTLVLSEDGRLKASLLQTFD